MKVGLNWCLTILVYFSFSCLFGYVCRKGHPHLTHSDFFLFAFFCYISIVLFQQPKLHANLLVNVQMIPVHKLLTRSLTWTFFWIKSSHFLMYQIHKTSTHMLNNKRLGQGNLMFCCSWEIYFGSISQHNNNDNPKFQGQNI